MLVVNVRLVVNSDAIILALIILFSTPANIAPVDVLRDLSKTLPDAMLPKKARLSFGQPRYDHYPNCVGCIAPIWLANQTRSEYDNSVLQYFNNAAGDLYVL